MLQLRAHLFLSYHLIEVPWGTVTKILRLLNPAAILLFSSQHDRFLLLIWTPQFYIPNYSYCLSTKSCSLIIVSIILWKMVKTSWTYSAIPALNKVLSNDLTVKFFFNGSEWMLKIWIQNQIRPWQIKTQHIKMYF